MKPEEHQELIELKEDFDRFIYEHFPAAQKVICLEKEIEEELRAKHDQEMRNQELADLLELKRAELEGYSKAAEEAGIAEYFDECLRARIGSLIKHHFKDYSSSPDYYAEWNRGISVNHYARLIIEDQLKPKKLSEAKKGRYYTHEINWVKKCLLGKRLLHWINYHQILREAAKLGKIYHRKKEILGQYLRRCHEKGWNHRELNDLVFFLNGYQVALQNGFCWEGKDIQKHLDNSLVSPKRFKKIMEQGYQLLKERKEYWRLAVEESLGQEYQRELKENPTRPKEAYKRACLAEKAEIKEELALEVKDD